MNYSNVYQFNNSSNQDTYINCNNVYAVFDGHGGDIASKELSYLFEKKINDKLKDINKYNNNLIKFIIYKCFIELDDIILSKIINNIDCGSTCAVIIRFYNKLILINLGDSNIVLYKNKEIFIIMKKHLYSNPEEKLIIDNNKNIIVKERYSPKVINETKRTMIPTSIINLKNTNECVEPTKSFGHLNWKNSNNMNVKPYIEIIDMENNNIYEAIIGTDGFFDMLINYEEIYNIANNSNNESAELAKFAYKRWTQKWNYYFNNKCYPNQVMDNDDITVIYCKFTKKN